MAGEPQTIRPRQTPREQVSISQPTPIPTTAAAHDIQGGSHTASGLTSGHVLRASSATTFAFAQLAHGDLGSVGANDHHNRSHAMTGSSDHTAGNWKVFYTNGAGVVTELALGATGTILKSSGASSAPTFADDAGPWVNIQDYGADPTGVADSGAAINSAITAAYSADVRRVYAPAGTYILETPIVLLDDVWLSGSGWHTAIFKIKGGNTNINAIDTTGNVYRARMTDFQIDCNKANNNANGMGIKGWYDHTFIERVWIKNCERDAIYLCPSDGYEETSYPNGVAYDTMVKDVEIEDSDIGIRLTSLCNDFWFGPRINCGSTTANVYITSQGSPFLFEGCWFNGNPTNNIHMPASGTNVWFRGCVIENAQQHGVLITEPSFLGADNESHIQFTSCFFKNANSSAGSYDAIHIEGYDATHRSVGITLVGNTFVNDVNTPRYGVYLKHVKDVKLGPNGQIGDFGTAYWFLDGTANANITINEPYPEEQRVTTDVTVNNTVTETTLFTQSVAGGNLVTDKRLRLTLEGKYLNNSGATRTLQVKVKYGATTMIDATSGAIAASANTRGFKWVVELSAQGATNAQLASIAGQMSSHRVGATTTTGDGDFYNAATEENHGIAVTGTAAEDSTAAKTFAVTLTHSAADANLTFTLQSAILEVI